MTIDQMTQTQNLKNNTNISAIDFLQSIFDDATIDSRLDKNTFCAYVLKESSGLHSLYRSVGEFTIYCKIWCKANNFMISKLLDTMEFDYNPIHNYDRHEEGSNKNKQTRNLERPTEDHIKNTTSAYNSSTMQPTDNVDSNGKTEDKGTIDDDASYKNYMYGNIGVTTTQDMIDAERRVDDYNIYEFLALRFVEDNFIKVW